MEQVEDSCTTKPPMVVMPFGYPTQPNSADGQAISIGREGATHNLKLLQYGMGHFLLPSTKWPRIPSRRWANYTVPI